MLKERNIGIAIILSLITCGIYYLYWIYAVTNEVGHLNESPNFTGGKTILFGIITCGIYFLFWFYQLGGQIAGVQAKKGLPQKDEGLMYVILAVFGMGLISLAIAQSNVNELVRNHA